MKFCEHFGITPLEYARLPRKKIELWKQMWSIENSVEQVKKEKN